jgi:hypothetical protein
MVGFEVQIKQANRLLPAYETLQLINSGEGRGLLEFIGSKLTVWSEKCNKPIYLSWELSGMTSKVELDMFLAELALFFPARQTELILNADHFQGDQALDKIECLFTDLSSSGVRRGLFHFPQMGFDIEDIFNCVEVIKLRKEVIVGMKEEIGRAFRGNCFFKKLNHEKIEVVVHGLYCKEDAACAVLIGIKYGQGYFFSRNAPQKAPVKTLKKSAGGFYEVPLGY